MMKYALNHTFAFDSPYVAFSIGLMYFLTSIGAEIIFVAIFAQKDALERMRITDILSVFCLLYLILAT